MCGRKFGANALARHERICQKVFAKKRKPFGPDAERMQRRQDNIEEQQQKRSQQPKWQDEHLAFQHMLKAGRTGPGGAPDAAPPPVADKRTQCPHCGRKFEGAVAERHIPHCEKAMRRKQLHGGKKPGAKAR